MVKADGSRSRGCEFEPRHRRQDGCNCSCAITMFNEKNKNKGNQMGHTKKIFKIFFCVKTQQ